MRPPQPLPEAALKELAALLKQCKDKATYQRVQCVWLRAALGLSAPQVAQALGWSLSAVHHVQARYLREGSAALLGSGRGGRAHANLSVTQEQHCWQTLLCQPLKAEWSKPVRCTRLMRPLSVVLFPSPPFIVC